MQGSRPSCQSPLTEMKGERSKRSLLAQQATVAVGVVVVAAPCWTPAAQKLAWPVTVETEPRERAFAESQTSWLCFRVEVATQTQAGRWACQCCMTLKMHEVSLAFPSHA